MTTTAQHNDNRSNNTRNNNRYNYDRFRPSFYDLASFAGPSAGDPMPDLTFRTIDGELRPLAAYLGQTVVLETGSVTCPMYAKGVPAMNRLAESHPDVVFLTLYVREAHPGERIGPHASDEEKRRQAGTVSSRLGDNRTVLVDDIEGTAHRALGLLPNMVYIVGPDGTVVFRGDWTDPEMVEAVLSGSADAEERAREHFPPAKPSPRTAITTLLSGGWLALFDFVVGLPALMNKTPSGRSAASAEPTVVNRSGRAAAPPWSGQVGWHVADWGPLGWAETAVKGLALTMVIVVALARLVDSGANNGWAVPTDHRLAFWLIVVVAVGYLGTLLDRLADREIISLVFVVVTLIGYWALAWLAGLPSWPAGLIRAFALLMAVGEAIKVGYFVTTGARVRRLPRALPIVMTSILAASHLVIAATA